MSIKKVEDIKLSKLRTMIAWFHLKGVSDTGFYYMIKICDWSVTREIVHIAREGQQLHPLL